MRHLPPETIAWLERSAKSSSPSITQVHAREILNTMEANDIDYEFTAERAGALESGVGIARVRLADGDAGGALVALDQARAKCPDLDVFMARYEAALRKWP